MKKILYPSETRGTADFGWLKARYSFSFANFYDPTRLQFGALRVLNDDIVGSGMGFGSHPHDNMEIITIPQVGSLRHKDSLGNEGIVSTGEIQVMSAGTGVEHSEINASKTVPLSLFQIWILPEVKNLEPRYDQKTSNSAEKINELNLVVMPKQLATSKELWIHQQAYISLGEFSKATTLEYKLHSKNHGVYVFVINGAATIENETLNKRDAIGIYEIDDISLQVSELSKVLLIEVPMN